MIRGSKILCLALVIFLSTSCLSPSVISINSGQDKDGSSQESPPPLQPDPTTEPEPTQTAGPVECGLDLDCFYNVLETCQISSVDYLQTLDFMGAVVSTTLQLEVNGPVDDRCEFSVITDEIEVSFSEEAHQQLKDSGMSDEEIEAQRRVMEESQAAAGFDEVCSGNPLDLIQTLQRWEQGQFSMADWEPFTCEGKIFASAETAPEPTDPPPPSAEPQPASGGNLIANKSFEADPGSVPPMWMIDPKGTDLVAEWTMDHANEGLSSLGLNASESVNQGFPGWSLSDPIQIEDPVWHLVQVWAFTPDGADAFVRVEYLDVNGETISYSGPGCKDLESNTWNQIEFGITEERLAGVSAIRLELLQCLTETGGTTTHLYYDDIYLGTTRP